MVDPHAHRTKAAGLALLALGVALYLLLGVGELADGDVGGIQHLVPALFLAALLWTGRRRPLLAGTVLLALGVALAATYAVLLVVRDVDPTSAPIVVLPPLAAGLLLVHAGRRRRGRRA